MTPPNVEATHASPVSVPRSPIRKFNPGTGQSDQELIDQFVVRENELEIVLDVLQRNIDAPSCQSTLVVAPRGAGKTMLLARVAAELRVNADFSQNLLPVRFMEESHEAYNIGEFWLEAVFHLILEIEATEPDFARDLRRSREDLCERWRPDLAPQALGTLLDAADRLDRRFVLLVENLQTLCRDADEHFGWALRGALQNEPSIMLLGSATTHFEQLREVDQPFFELFRFVDLRPLDTSACLRLWRTVSGDDASERTVRPLEIFTGGSPRLLVMMAEFALHRSLPQLMEELVTLVDNHTEYFRGHLEHLPRGERRTYIAIIDLWQPSSTSEIAKRARMDIRNASTWVGRLMQRGLVSAQGEGRRKRYVASERLYSIYYKLRRERDEAAVVRNLIHFMAAFYTAGELVEMSGDLMRGATESAVHQGITRALHDVPQFLSAFEAAVVDSVTADIEQGRHKSALESCERLLSGAPLPRETVCKLLLLKADCLSLAGDHQSALVGYDEGISALGEMAHGEQDDGLIIVALVAKGCALNEAGDAAGAVATLRTALDRYGDCGIHDVQPALAAAQFNIAVALQGLADHDGAVNAYETLDRTFSTTEDEEVQLCVAQGLVNLGVLLSRDMDSHQSAIDTNNRVLNLFGRRNAPRLRRVLARALLHRGISQFQIGDHESATSSWNELRTRFLLSLDDVTRDIVAVGMVCKATGLAAAGLLEQSRRTVHLVLKDFKEAEGPPVREQIGRALIVLCDLEIQSDRPSDALAASMRVEREFGPLDDELLWSARCHSTRAYLALGNLDGARSKLKHAYQAFVPTLAATRQLVRMLSEALAAQMPAATITDILNDDDKANALAPVLTALRLETGEDVRAPNEVLEVAEDIRRSWQERS